MMSCPTMGHLEIPELTTMDRTSETLRQNKSFLCHTASLRNLSQPLTPCSSLPVPQMPSWYQLLLTWTIQALLVWHIFTGYPSISHASPGTASCPAEAQLTRLGRYTHPWLRWPLPSASFAVCENTDCHCSFCLKCIRPEAVVPRVQERSCRVLAWGATLECGCWVCY